MKITKRQLRRIIKEEKQKLIFEQSHEMYASDDELRELGAAIESLVHWTMETNLLMERMTERYEELEPSLIASVKVSNQVEDLVNGYELTLDNMLRNR
jgi:hypothetical protein